MRCTRNFRFSVVGVILLAAVAACGSGQDGASPSGKGGGASSAAGHLDKVNLLLDFTPSPKDIPLVWGIKHGVFAKYGIDLKLTPGTGSNFSVPEVSANKVQFALGDIDTYLGDAMRANAGASSVEIENYEPVAATGIVSHTPITNLHQLVGKTFGTVANSSGIVDLKYTLKQNGIDPSDVQIDLVDFPVLYSEFFQGKFFSAEMDEPGDENVISEAKTLGKPAYHVSLAKFGFVDDATTLIASGAVIKNNPDLVRRMATAVYESQVQAAAKASTQDVIKDFQTLVPTDNAAYITAGWADYKQVVKNPGRFDLGQVENIRTRILGEINSKSSTFSAQQAFTNQYLPKSAKS